MSNVACTRSWVHQRPNSSKALACVQSVTGELAMLLVEVDRDSSQNGSAVQQIWELIKEKVCTPLHCRLGSINVGLCQAAQEVAG